MPIGRRPPVTSSEGGFTIPGVESGIDGVRPGAAIALIEVSGSPKFVECGSTTHASNFYGFSKLSVSSGSPVYAVTMRGSEVTPIVEGGSSLIPGRPLYLSATPGEVTHSPPSSGLIIRVGNAFSSTKMTINTDTRVGVL
jgi:hypothetical protein